MRRGTITSTDATQACALFRADLLVNYQVIEITNAAINQAMTLAETHGLRGYDAIQLAIAIEINNLLISSELPPLNFISADNDLNAATLSEGLLVDNPNAHL